MTRPTHKDMPQTRLAARKAALAVIGGVLAKNRTLEDMLASPPFAALAGDDRAFASFLIRTTLRRLGQIDALIDHCLDRPLPAKARIVHDCLRLGIAQLLFSGTADHAAVSTTVELCRDAGQFPYAKLANAVMRRIQREGAELVEAQDAQKLNTPAWLFASWVDAYGEATARAIADAHLETPPLDLTPKRDAETWARDLLGDVVLGGTVRLTDGGDVAKLPGFEDGAWWVQDAAARLPVLLAGDVAGKTAYDLCAAPGGKTMELANGGATVTALDISKNRLARVAENLARVGLSAELMCADARQWQAPAPADVVLLDAPCSATGTVRRHPDVPYLKTPADIAKLAAVQDALLSAAADMVAPGGLLIYATCSLQPEEGPERIAAFLENDPRFAREAVSAAEIGGLDNAVTADGDLRTLPCQLAEIGGLDGFYAARLRRRD